MFVEVGTGLAVVVGVAVPALVDVGVQVAVGRIASVGDGVGVPPNVALGEGVAPLLTVTSGMCTFQSPLLSAPTRNARPTRTSEVSTSIRPRMLPPRNG